MKFLSFPGLILFLGACQSTAPKESFNKLDVFIDGSSGNYQKQTQDVLDELATQIDSEKDELKRSHLMGEYAKLSYISEDWDRLFGLFYVCPGCSEVADRLHSLALLKFCYTQKAQEVAQGLVNKKDPYGGVLSSLATLSQKHVPPSSQKSASIKVDGSRIRKWPLLGTQKAPLRLIRVRTQNLCEQGKKVGTSS